MHQEEALSQDITETPSASVQERCPVHGGQPRAFAVPLLYSPHLLLCPTPVPLWQAMRPVGASHPGQASLSLWPAHCQPLWFWEVLSC